MQKRYQINQFCQRRTTYLRVVKYRVARPIGPGIVFMNLRSPDLDQDINRVLKTNSQYEMQNKDISSDWAYISLPYKENYMSIMYPHFGT